MNHTLYDLYATIEYKFKDESLVKTALTHSSFANEISSKNSVQIICNERLEFLGDSILSHIVSDYLFLNYPKSREGDLSKMRSFCVCEEALAGYAYEINLNSFLLLGKGEELSGGRNNNSIVSDAFEALLAALYLDSSYENVKSFVLPFVIRKLDEYNHDPFKNDYKTALQQIVQQEQGEKLQYILVSKTGPDNAPLFNVEARLNSNLIGSGIGKTKRDAEQAAAKEALKLFSDHFSI